jgi:hypothetical protein
MAVRRSFVIGSVLAIVAVTGCSGSDDASTAPSLTTPASSSSSDVFSESGEGPDVGVTFEPVSETGVPGIDSEDAFCRSWSEYAGSFNALTYAWNVQLPADAAALEVAASAAVAAAVAGMSANLPAEIEGNRQALTADVPGPFLRRAERARALLIEAGADDATVAALGDAWIAAITQAGLFADDLAIVVPDNAAEPLSAAAASFVAEFPSVLEDPTLDTTRFDISPSLDYISRTCPDQGTLAGNDNVEVLDAP